MHELSLCHAIAGVVRSHADGRPVEVVRVRVGALRQVVADSLLFCWSVVAEHDGLAGAALELEQVPAAVSCRVCGQESEITSRWSVCCPACGSADVTVIRGEEFLVTSIDITTCTTTDAATEPAGRHRG
ncbi:hydrogenase maturation nickel metallochaperone HypA [Mycobacterium kyogaense]|uniref:hydrogenase maturation nickel metallochaperone HypA n=1 Tax=Mycobacterium kyogaense TaxID=2212479 RepID=UPI000DAC28FC|nr:hydrogenase maturation nickel metallochaperone HypA [Mycobacterium kyogaense]